MVIMLVCEYKCTMDSRFVWLLSRGLELHLSFTMFAYSDLFKFDYLKNVKFFINLLKCHLIVKNK